jgi:hypothetical protein
VDQFGQELRLTIDGDDLPRTHVTGTAEDFVRIMCEWMELLQANGWIPSVPGGGA